MNLVTGQERRAENRKTAMILVGIMIALVATAIIDILVTHSH